MRPKALTDSVIFFAAQLVARLINFLYFLVLTRTLPIDEFGVLNYVLSIIVLLDILLDLGLSRHALREVSKDTRLAGTFIRRILPYKLAASTLVFCVFVAIIVTSAQPGAHKAISAFAALGLFFTSPAMLLENILHAHHRFRLISLAHLSLAVIQFAIGGAMLLAGGSTIAISLTFALTYMAYAGIVGWGVVKLPLTLPPRADYKALARSIPAAFPYLISAVAIMFAIRAELVILGFFGSNADLAVFGMATKIVEASLLVPMAFSTVMTPRFSKAHGLSGDVLSRVYYAGLEIMLLVAIPVSLIAMMLVPVAQFAFGTADYDAIDDLLYVTFLGFVPASVFLYNAAALFGAVNQKRPLAILSGLGILQVSLNVALQSTYGIYGAAAAFTAFMTLAAVISFIAIHLLYARAAGWPRVLTASAFGLLALVPGMLIWGRTLPGLAVALTGFVVAAWLARKMLPGYVTDLDVTPEDPLVKAE